MERAKLYAWEETYVAAILETDNVKLVECIRAADTRIRARLEELSMTNGAAAEELKALSDALKGLNTPATERPGETSSSRL